MTVQQCGVGDRLATHWLRCRRRSHSAIVSDPQPGKTVAMDRLPYGYTNSTRVVPRNRIEKRYEGPERRTRARVELACLHALKEVLPVPPVVASDLSAPRLVTQLLGGRPAQELLGGRHDRIVLRLLGTTLRQIQALSTDAVPGLLGAGHVIVHGDFGPQNLHLDLGRQQVSGIFDWEWAHVGSPVEDLAWAEWIVRIHHPHAISSLEDFFDAANLHPPWPERHASMVARCRTFLQWSTAAHNTDAVSTWQKRLALTEAWHA